MTNHNKKSESLGGKRVFLFFFLEEDEMLVLCILIFVVCFLGYCYFRRIEEDLESVIRLNEKIIGQAQQAIEHCQDILNNNERITHLEKVSNATSDVVKELLEVSKNRSNVLANIIDTMQKLTSSVAELESRDKK